MRCYDGDAQVVISAALCVRARCKQRSGMRLGSPNSIASMLDGPPKRGRDPGGKSINPRCHQLFSADATVPLTLMTLTLTFCPGPAIRWSSLSPLPQKDRGKPSEAERGNSLTFSSSFWLDCIWGVLFLHRPAAPETDARPQHAFPIRSTGRPLRPELRNGWWRAGYLLCISLSPMDLPSCGPKQGLQRRPPTTLPDCRIMAQASNYRSSWDQRPTILTIRSNPGFVAQTCWGRACSEGPLALLSRPWG